MDSLMQIDDLMENYVIQINPLHGAIIADFALQNTALSIRDNFWTDDFHGGTRIPRTQYSIGQAGQVFWTLFIKYCLPTAQEYFGWCRDMLMNIACFEKLYGIRADGLNSISAIEQIMNELARFIGYKTWTFARNGGDQYAKDIKQNPPAAYNFILNLFPKDNPHFVIQLEKSRAAKMLLQLLRDCSIEVVDRLRDMVYKGRVSPEQAPLFTKSEKFIKCRSTVLGQDFIGSTPNQNLRYPELLRLHWGDFQDRHTTLREDTGDGPILDLIRSVKKDDPRSRPINDLMFLSRCMPRVLEHVIDEVATIRLKEGAVQAVRHGSDRLDPHLYLTVLSDEYIQQFNYNVALGLLLGDPIPLQQMDVDAGPGAPLQQPKKPKPEKKKDEPDSLVFWLVGLGALGLFAIGAF